MYPHPRAHPQDELFMTNTISEDMSGRDTSSEINASRRMGYFAVPPNELAVSPNPQMTQNPQSDQAYAAQLRLLEQQNARRRQPTLSQFSQYPPRAVGPETSISYPGSAGVASYQYRQSAFAPAPAPFNPFPQGPANPNVPYGAPIQQSRSPTSENSYETNPQYQNTARSPMYTPPSQGSVSLSEANDLRDQITALQAKVRELEGKPAVATASKYQILYRIERDRSYQGNNRRIDDSDDEFRPRRGRQSRCRPRSPSRSPSPSPWMGIYTDPPELIHRNFGAPYLRCNEPLTNFELYLALNRDISFIIFRNYRKRAERQLPNKKYGKPEPFSETIFPVSEDLKDVIGNFLSGPEFQSMDSDFRALGEVQSPYLFIYHNRGAKQSEIKRRLSSEAQRQFDLLMNYVQETWGKEYAAADQLFGKGKIRLEYVQYLFKPTDLLVSAKDKSHIGYVAKDWPVRAQVSYGTGVFWWISAQTWDFDGDFHKRWSKLRFEMPESPHEDESESAQLSHSFDELGLLPSSSDPDKSPDKEHAITDLAVFPITYAPEELVQKLQRRGEIFWKFRTQQYVSYQAAKEEHFQIMADDRYIIDMKTYNKMHIPPLTPNSNIIPVPHRSTLSENALAKEHPPPGHFSMMMPPVVTGFSLRRKKWFDLSADRISEVKWNKNAFESIAIEPKSRDLIEALVTNHLELDYSTDLIAGKGNGLILLLHGGPGTGKTLTAESVAEIAERPLYRVTCGDVGTKPEEVERYLESVLHLGKVWNCVVLLDEADVFLEQRGLEDLNRNALVSAFLRVVEYFEGILILTTNRVGTFDEAFKSRIQLALHYPPLGEEQRRIIWKTFIERLDEFGEDAPDVENLLGSLDVLQTEKLNGRQIRNAITTARQYAKWKEEVLTYEHLRDVIEVSARFDDYLENIHRLDGIQG